MGHAQRCNCACFVAEQCRNITGRNLYQQNRRLALNSCFTLHLFNVNALKSTKRKVSLLDVAIPKIVVAASMSGHRHYGGLFLLQLLPLLYATFLLSAALFFEDLDNNQVIKTLDHALRACNVVRGSLFWPHTGTELSLPLHWELINPTRI
jgi:hypothetical protein